MREISLAPAAASEFLPSFVCEPFQVKSNNFVVPLNVAAAWNEPDTVPTIVAFPEKS